MNDRKFLAAATLLALTGFAAPNTANAQAYVSGSLGLFAPNDLTGSSGGVAVEVELDKGIHAAAAIGYRLPINLRLEGEFAYAHTKASKGTVPGVGSVDISGGDIDVFTFMANAFYDIKTGTMFTPYLGGGIGAAHQELDDFTIGGVAFTGGSGTDFAWQLEGGVAIDITPHLSVVPSYRYLHINDGGTEGGVTADDTEAHIFKVGLRYTF